MKKLILPLILFCFFISGYSQTDTLFTRKQEKISCKIIEISEFDIKYKLATAIDGPVYVINKTTVTKYTLSNGFSELLLPDELSLENEHAEIIRNRTVIKIHPFSVVNNQISVAFEKVIKVGTNLDIEAGYINNSINKAGSLGLNQIYTTSGNAFYSGAYVKPGVKFFLGQDFSVKGLKYAHPLKGRYIKLDIALSYLNFQDVVRSGAYGYSGIPVTMLSTNINALAYGGFVNFGRQFILGNILTMEYYGGIGFTGSSISYSNKNYSNSPYFYPNDASAISNYHGFLRIPTFGLSFTAGFRIGYILPEKKSHKKPSSQIGK